jgi:hypothetical protein
MVLDTGAGAVGEPVGTGGHKSAHSPGLRPPCPTSHNFPRSAHCSTLKMEVAGSSENWYLFTRGEFQISRSFNGICFILLGVDTFFC